jgi:hypothetical protein
MTMPPNAPLPIAPSALKDGRVPSVHCRGAVKGSERESGGIAEICPRAVVGIFFDRVTRSLWSCWPLRDVREGTDFLEALAVFVILFRREGCRSEASYADRDGKRRISHFLFLDFPSVIALSQVTPSPQFLHRQVGTAILWRHSLPTYGTWKIVGFNVRADVTRTFSQVADGSPEHHLGQVARFLFWLCPHLSVDITALLLTQPPQTSSNSEPR